MRYLKALKRAENKKEPDKAQEVVEVTEVEVNEEEEWMTEEETQQVDERATWTWNKFARVRRKK